MRPKQLQHPSCRHSDDCRADVVVVGGGMSGCVAALAAARHGARVYLIEQNAFLGGAATAGGVGQFVGWRTKSGRQVIDGLASALVQRLRAEGGCGALEHFTMSTGHRMDRIQYDADLLKIVLDQLLIEAGVTVLLKSALIDCEVRDGRVERLTLWSAGNRLHVTAPVYIDGSGDMTLLSKAGASFLELDKGASLQPATMMFALAPVDFETLDAVPADARARIAKAGVQAGALPRAALHYSRAPESDAAWFNISRVSLDPEDPFSVSRAEIEGRRQALEISRFLIRHLPGCEKAALSALAPQLGIRDTRRVRGDYVITRQDIVSGARFADTIACGAYPIDIHLPDSPDLRFEELGEDHYYSIPYRAMLPASVVNVIATGRGVSADSDAFAALRVMPTAMAMGHTAGIAAAMAAHAGQGAARSVPNDMLRAALRAQSAFLGDC